MLFLFKSGKQHLFWSEYSPRHIAATGVSSQTQPELLHLKAHVTVYLEGVNGLELSGWSFAEGRKHIDEVAEAQVPLSVLGERLHDSLSKRVFLSAQTQNITQLNITANKNRDVRHICYKVLHQPAEFWPVQTVPSVQAWWRWASSGLWCRGCWCSPAALNVAPAHDIERVTCSTLEQSQQFTQESNTFTLITFYIQDPKFQTDERKATSFHQSVSDQSLPNKMMQP